jgi:hypothetical protein
METAEGDEVELPRLLITDALAFQAKRRRGCPARDLRPKRDRSLQGNER